MENTLKKGLPKSLSYSSTCVTPFQPQNHLSKIPLVNKDQARRIQNTEFKVKELKSSVFSKAIGTPFEMDI